MIQNQQVRSFNTWSAQASAGLMQPSSGLSQPKYSAHSSLMQFKVFTPHYASFRQKQGLWAVLFIGEHPAYTHFEVVWPYQEHQIDIITFFPHCPHLTQPLDLTKFKSWRDSLQRVCIDSVLFYRFSEILKAL